jgi:hypothetical protein
LLGRASVLPVVVASTATTSFTTAAVVSAESAVFVLETGAIFVGCVRSLHLLSVLVCFGLAITVVASSTASNKGSCLAILVLAAAVVSTESAIFVLETGAIFVSHLDLLSVLVCYGLAFTVVASSATFDEGSILTVLVLAATVVSAESAIFILETGAIFVSHLDLLSILVCYGLAFTVVAATATTSSLTSSTWNKGSLLTVLVLAAAVVSTELASCTVGSLFSVLATLLLVSDLAGSLLSACSSISVSSVLCYRCGLHESIQQCLLFCELNKI